MTATELFRNGRLADAIAAQVAAVKARPGDAGVRTFLFELLLFAGDLDRAAKHLDAVRAETPELVASAEAYRGVLAAEKARRAALAGKAEPPAFFGEVPEHARLRVEALRDPTGAAAAESFAAADRAAPDLTGSLNGAPFEGLRDADDLFGTVLEVFAQGKYFWVPFEQVAGLSANPPKFPRDTLYVPARLTLADESSGDVFLPALYPDSYESADDAVKLGRATAWESGAGGVRGHGHRTVLIGDADVGLVEVRELSVSPAPPKAG
ncbi:type VI secretion system accessory protein TagJ [Gemmata sp.]|uniref:type VI secretion system accessory protein TagJ n=1 Tax=Gemmata sp. TaxID=1914242 RepID=UPI003F6FBBA4